MTFKALLVVAVATMGSVFLGGCSTAFQGSAPAAQAGTEYVVGHRGGRRTIWLCPVGAAAADCRHVEVQD